MKTIQKTVEGSGKNQKTGKGILGKMMPKSTQGANFMGILEEINKKALKHKKNKNRTENDIEENENHIGVVVDDKNIKNNKNKKNRNHKKDNIFSENMQNNLILPENSNVEGNRIFFNGNISSKSHIKTDNHLLKVHSDSIKLEEKLLLNKQAKADSVPPSPASITIKQGDKIIKGELEGNKLNNSLNMVLRHGSQKPEQQKTHSIQMHNKPDALISEQNVKKQNKTNESEKPVSKIISQQASSLAPIHPESPLNQDKTQAPELDKKTADVKIQQQNKQILKSERAEEKAEGLKIEVRSNTANFETQKDQSGTLNSHNGDKKPDYHQIEGAGILNAQQRIHTEKVSDIIPFKNLQEESIIRQVTDKTVTELNNDNTNITISLDPENLGRVDINIVSNNGTLTAQITAENNNVRDILDSGLENLRQNLLDQGINIEKIVVNVNNSNDPTNYQNNQQQDQGLYSFNNQQQEKSGAFQSNNTGYHNDSGSYKGYTGSEEYNEATSADRSYEQPEKPESGRVDYRA